MPVNLPARLPEDVEAERGLIATCCAPGAEAMAADLAFLLKEEDFVHPAHRAVFLALRDLLANSIEVNALTLKDALSRQGTLNKVGGFGGLTELLAAAEVGRPQVLADILRKKSAQRHLIRLGSSLVQEATQEATSPDELVTSYTRKLFHVMQGDGRLSGMEALSEFSASAQEGILDRWINRGCRGIQLGLPRLDLLIEGLRPGNLVILAARPGIGKTALALNWAHSVARAGRSVAFASLEMSKEEVYERLLAINLRLDLKSTLAGPYDPTAARRLADARTALDAMDLLITDQASVTVPQLGTYLDLAEARLGRKVEMLVVDYLQLLSSAEGSRGARQNEAVRVAELSRSLKLLAKDRGIPVIVLSQLNREVEHRQGGRPQLSDLRDSGAIEQDADLVMFIHRKMAPVMPGEEPDPSAELLVSKHRNGPTGVVPMLFMAPCQVFLEQERYT